MSYKTNVIYIESQSLNDYNHPITQQFNLSFAKLCLISSFSFTFHIN